MKSIIENVRKDLKDAVDPTTKDNHKRYFKEEVKYYGLKAAKVHTIAKKYWLKIQKMEKTVIFSLCEELLQSGWGEEAILVGLWMPKMHKSFVREDIIVFREWIDKYIDNWAECDTFCNHTMERFLERFPEAIEEIKSWTASDNLWMKRAAAVSLIIPARRGKFLDAVFQIADNLIDSHEDMVQKGYGWMLKEASKTHQREVYEFILDRRHTMPRTALRYAIEKMPEEMKKEAMRK
jgi:3-methyladenine DNA glycosylase AlkD